MLYVWFVFFFLAISRQKVMTAFWCKFTFKCYFIFVTHIHRLDLFDLIYLRMKKLTILTKNI